MKMYVLGTHLKFLLNVVLMSAHNICFHGENRKYQYVLVEIALAARSFGIINSAYMMQKISHCRAWIIEGACEGWVGEGGNN